MKFLFLVLAGLMTLSAAGCAQKSTPPKSEQSRVSGRVGAGVASRDMSAVQPPLNRPPY